MNHRKWWFGPFGCGRGITLYKLKTLICGQSFHFLQKDRLSALCTRVKISVEWGYFPRFGRCRLRHNCNWWVIDSRNWPKRWNVWVRTQQILVHSTISKKLKFQSTGGLESRRGSICSSFPQHNWLDWANRVLINCDNTQIVWVLSGLLGLFD